MLDDNVAFKTTKPEIKLTEEKQPLEHMLNYRNLPYRFRVFTARRNACIAIAVLATAIPSVCPSVRLSVCPSVTRRYCVKTTACGTVQFALSDSKMCLAL